MIEVTLRITGVDLDADSTAHLIGEKFPDTLWESANGMNTLTIFVDRKDAVAGVVDVAHRLEKHLEGFKILGVYRDLIGVTDIALRAGVSREGARKWTMTAGFPEPFDYIGATSSKVWAWTQILDWLKSARGLDLEQELPSLALMTQIENCLMRNPDHTTVQWHQTATKIQAAAPVFHRIKPAVRVNAGGRAQKTASDACVLVGAAAHG